MLIGKPNTIISKRKVMTEKEIDRIVIVQADNESAWEKPVKVRKSNNTVQTLSAKLFRRSFELERYRNAMELLRT